MNKFLLPMNLQLFADDEEIEVEIDENDIDLDEVEIEDDEDDTAADDDAGEEDQKDEDDTKDEESKDDKGKNTTAAAVIAERKKWQAKLAESEKHSSATRKLMAQAGVTDIDEFVRRLDAIEAQKLTKQGIDPELAQSIVQGQREIADMKQTLQKQKYDGEAEKLKADPFFADLDDYREEFEQIAERTGQTLEEVYFAKRGRQRMKEREAEIEVRVKNNQQKRDSKKVDTSESGEGKPKSRVQLTADERAVAKMAGMTDEEYYKFKKK